jgi:beta-lactamase class A
MITISDNTATNMLIERLGGIAALNERFRSWGLSTTNLRNVLPDIEGTNSTSPKELVNLIAMVSKGNLVSTASRDRILDIMRRTVKDNLLPSGIGQGATIAHKTGEIGGILADAGLVDLANGKRYLIATIVQRPRNDASAEKLISSISRATFGQFSQAGIAPNNPPSGTNIQPTPINPVQPPVVTSPLSHTNPVPMPHTGYQQPGISPIPSSSTYMTPIPNNMGGVPTTTYQSPVVTPQYYYPYQR